MASSTERSRGVRPRPGDTRDETPDQRVDRNTAEMVQELRVGAVGIQVLFAFLLIVPFNAGWKYTSSFERATYYVTLVCIAISTALLIAPSVHHRVLFRQGEKPFVVWLGSKLMIAGMAFLTGGMTGIFVLITDYVFGGVFAVIAGALTALAVSSIWFGIPLLRRAHDRSAERFSDPGRGSS